MLTLEQKKVIDADEKYILVRAGAGTGKTEVLTRRILRLLEDDPQLRLRDIAVITFTNKATENMLMRLKRYLFKQWKMASKPEIRRRYRYELESLNCCQVSTIHKFCRSILDLAGPVKFSDFSYSPAYRVSQGVLYAAIEEAFESWLARYEKKGKEVLHCQLMPVYEVKRVVLDAYKMLRARGISIDQAIEKTKEEALLEEWVQPRRLKLELVEILSILREIHLEKKLDTLDPDDILEYCYRVLKQRPDIVQEVRTKYKHLLVDEFQDTSRFQTGILRLICGDLEEGPSLFVVGDYKQSIYQFRGADIKSFESTANWIKVVGKEYTLSTNFRSTPELVTLVNRTFRRLAEKYPEYKFKIEELEPTGEPGQIDRETYEWIWVPESSLQPQAVAEYLRKQIDAGASPSEFALLFRTNDPMMEYARKLDEADIPYQLVGAGDFYNQREVVDTYKIMNFLLAPQKGICRDEALNTIYFSGDRKSFARFEEEMKKISSGLTPAQILDQIYRKTKIRERLVGMNPQAAANLNKLKALTRQMNLSENWQLVEFVGWLQRMIFSRSEEQQADCFLDPEESNAVTLITIHRAKGLEFPIVILPQLDQSYSKSVRKPPVVYSVDYGLELSYQRYSDQGQTSVSTSNYEEIVKEYENEMFSEEMRVLYVAMTRAEKKLVFVGSEDCPKDRICFQNWLC
ncbi:MAG: UvrD-helicase domain-containing protein [Thermosipho sp. (in: Bacteria)]|nr:UvrD-helicase domain-containing protein [Thermosipho sp. (in: thermotogales)]